MLVITRKLGQGFMLTVPGFDRPIFIRIEPKAEKKNAVSVTIDAPAEVIVAREELYWPKKETPHV